MPKLSSSDAARALVARRWNKQRAADAAAPADQESVESARTRRLRAMADRAELEARRMRGELVDRARAVQLVQRLAQEERDAILAWPARVAAEMAAELGVDALRLQTAMDRRLREHLAARHEVSVDIA